MHIPMWGRIKEMDTEGKCSRQRPERMVPSKRMEVYPLGHNIYHWK